MKKILVSLFLLLSVPIPALSQTNFSEKGIRIFKLIVADDYQKSVSGGKHIFPWGRHDYSFDTQAHFLAREYRDDSKSANSKYLGKWIRINGPTDRIGSDASGKPFVDLGVFSDSSSDIRATFVSDSAFYAGREGPIICQITGMRSSKPVLTECRYQYLIGSEYNVPPFIDQPVNDWLSNGIPPWFAPEADQKIVMFVALYAADQLAANGPCNTTSMTSECGDSYIEYINRLLRSNSDDLRTSYKENQTFLGLPPLKK